MEYDPDCFEVLQGKDWVNQTNGSNFPKLILFLSHLKTKLMNQNSISLVEKWRYINGVKNVFLLYNAFN